MSYLYVCEQGSTINYAQNRFSVTYKDGMISSIPAETLEEIAVFGAVQITTQCIQECLKRGIAIIYYSKNGAYFGRLISTSHMNVRRQRKQAALGKDKEFCLSFSKNIIYAKISNQIVVLRRYARSIDKDIDSDILVMKNTLRKIQNPLCADISHIMGYEGLAAKTYFKVLGEMVAPEFSFKGRTRRPPLDPFNSVISLGYSILMNEIYGKLTAKGLNPYFGFMHQDRENHPTLASDLLEEWRAVFIDSLAMSLFNGNELSKDNFYTNIDVPGIFLDKAGLKIFIRKLENKLRTNQKYIRKNENGTSFRAAMDHQVNLLAKAIDNEDPYIYTPIRIR